MTRRKLKRQGRKSEKLEFVQDYLPIKDLKNGIIETADGRYIKILEVDPINFTLRSDEEQFNIISSFASWLKISPMRLQFKSITRKADSDRHIAMVRKELEQEGIRGLAVMPVDSEAVREKLNALIEEKNIPVVTFNSDIVGTRRACFVGMDNRKSGRTAAGLLGMMTRGSGKILIITGYFSNHVDNQRVDGFVEEAKRAFPHLEIAGVHGSFDEASEVEHIIENAMMSTSGISGILVVSGGQAGVGKAFDKLRLDRRPYVVIYDQTPKNEKALKNDSVDFLIDQNGYVQGYEPPRILADILTKGQEPEREFLFTDIKIKTKYNL